MQVLFLKDKSTVQGQKRCTFLEPLHHMLLINKEKLPFSVSKGALLMVLVLHISILQKIRVVSHFVTLSMFYMGDRKLLEERKGKVKD